MDMEEDVEMLMPNQKLKLMLIMAMGDMEDMDMDVNEDQLSPTTDMAVVMEATVDMVVMEVMDMVVNINETI